MSKEEVIEGLEDLVKDRRSFKEEEGDIFDQDIKTLQEAIRFLEGGSLVGKSVRIRDDLNEGDIWGGVKTTNTKAEMAGKIVTISTELSETRVEIEEYPTFTWHKKMFDKVYPFTIGQEVKVDGYPGKVEHIMSKPDAYGREYVVSYYNNDVSSRYHVVSEDKLKE